MRYLPKNIKIARELKKLSQLELAEILDVGRSNISNWEKGISTPHAEIIVKISKLFDISLDDLLTKDLSINGYSGVKTTTINVKSDFPSKNIFVPIAAQAGYLGGYGQEYINQEPVYVNIPGVEGEARTFEIDGDSMAPVLMHGDFVVCRRVENPEGIKNRNIYVVVAPVSGIVAKYIEPYKDGLHLISEDKALFKPIVCPYEEVKEIWEVTLRITNHLIHPRYYADNDSVLERLRILEEMMALKRPLKED